MLGKLLKYDLKWINKVMVIYFIIMAILALLTGMIERIDDKTTMIVIVDKVLSTLMISCAVSISITAIMRIWARFKINIYKDESYLTHTLPVTKNQIFNSKILAEMIIILEAFIVIVAAFLFVILSVGGIDAIKDLYKTIADIFGNSMTNMLIVSVVLLVYLEVLFMTLSGITGMIKAHKSNSAKVLRTIIYGLIIYAVLSVLVFVIFYIIAQSNPSMKELYTKGALPSPEAFQTLIFSAVIIYAVYDIALYFICKRMLNKGVDVD